MKNKVCCGFGHRQVYDPISPSLYKILENLIVKENCTVFMTGKSGEFDECFSSALFSLKRSYPHISVILVMPYLSKELNAYKTVYEHAYDEIVIPEISASAHYKAAIKLRNRWMIDHSDFVISYLFRDFGGAYEAVKYASKQNKNVIDVLSSMDGCDKQKSLPDPEQVHQIF